MSEVELKKQVWVLSNKNNELETLNAQLNHRLNEYIIWSEQAQRELETLRAQVQQLEVNNRVLYEKVSQGTVSMSQNLLDENSRLKLQLQDFQEHQELTNELIVPLVFATINNIDSTIKHKLMLSFKKGDVQKRILSLFLNDPQITLTNEEATRETGYDLTSTSSTLKLFDRLNYIREIKQDHYQLIQTVGDKVVSSNDLSRVSLDTLNDHIIGEIRKVTSSDDHTKFLEIFHSELLRRGENEFASQIISLKGQIHMGQRSSEWIIDEIEEFIRKNDVLGSSQSISNLNKETPGGIRNKSTTLPDSNQKFDQSSYQTSNSSQTKSRSYDTSHWKSQRPHEIISDCQSHLTNLSTIFEAVALLSDLRDHLESSISGSVLYQINSKINELKKAKNLDKRVLKKSLQEWWDKVEK